MSRIVLGDCLSVLPTLPDRCVDLVLTDPPYLVNYVDRHGRSIINDRRDEWLVPAFAQIFRVLRDDAFCISFYGWNRVDRFFAAWRAVGLRAVGHIVFAKAYQSKARFLCYRHEAAYLLAKGRPPLPAAPLPDVMPWKYSGNRHHPTQKPVECLAPLIETFTRPRAIVLDPFAGSGSTCVAARQVGRRFYGIEMDPKYHAVALQRLQLNTAERSAA